MRSKIKRATAVMSACYWPLATAFYVMATVAMAGVMLSASDLLGTGGVVAWAVLAVSAVVSLRTAIRNRALWRSNPKDAR